MIHSDSFDYIYLKERDRVHFFTDIPNWIHYLKSFSLFVGARFHGTVAAILAGIPSIITPFDARTRELAAFHHIPAIVGRDLEKDYSIDMLYDLADYGQMCKAQESNLLHYKDFLKKNKLSCLLYETEDISFGQSPMEKQIFSSWKPAEPFHAYEMCNKSERIARSVEYAMIKGVKTLSHILKSR